MTKRWPSIFTMEREDEIQSIVDKFYPNPKMGQCPIINGTVTEFLRVFVGDNGNNTGKVYLVQGKAYLSGTIYDRPVGYTDEPDHIFLAVNDRSLTYKGKQTLFKMIDDGRYDVWDFASRIFTDKGLDVLNYYAYDELGYPQVNRQMLKALKDVVR